jgi:hypothetical protein
LRPDRPTLRRILNDIHPADLLLLEGRTRELFSQAIATVKNGKGLAPLNALDVCSVTDPAV